MDFELSCSGNGSSLGQLARAEYAEGRITPQRMRGGKVLTRSGLGLVATGPRPPVWLSLSRLPSRTKKEMQGGSAAANHAAAA